MKLDLPEHKKRVFSMTIPIRWGDMDGMNRTNIAGDPFFEYSSSEENEPHGTASSFREVSCH